MLRVVIANPEAQASSPVERESRSLCRKATRVGAKILRRVGVLVALILGTAAAAVAGDDTTRTSSIFAPISAPADAVRTIAMLVLAITAAIAVIVGGLLTYSIVRFRLRPGDDGSEPPQV